jgi:hypothetical protein
MPLGSRTFNCSFGGLTLSRTFNCSFGGLTLSPRVHDDLAFVADGSTGLKILRFALPDATRITGHALAEYQLTIRWKGRGSTRLEHTPGLDPPNWKTVPGSAGRTQLQMPLQDRSGFFRAAREDP